MKKYNISMLKRGLFLIFLSSLVFLYQLIHLVVRGVKIPPADLNIFFLFSFFILLVSFYFWISLKIPEFQTSEIGEKSKISFEFRMIKAFKKASNLKDKKKKDIIEFECSLN